MVFLFHPGRLDAASTNIPVVAVEQSDADMYKIFEKFGSGSKNSSQATPYQEALAAAEDGSGPDHETVRLQTGKTSRSHSFSFRESPQQVPANPVGTTKFYGGPNAQKSSTQTGNSQTQPITPKNPTANNLQAPRKLNPVRTSDALKTARYNTSGQNAHAMQSANYSEEQDQSDVDMRSLVHGGSAQFDVEYEEGEEDYEEEELADPPQAPLLSRRTPPQPPQPPQQPEPPQPPQLPQPSVQRSALADLDAALTSDLPLTPTPMSEPVEMSQVNPMYADQMPENPDAIAKTETGESDSILNQAFPGASEKSGSKLALFSKNSNTASVLNVMGCLCLVLGVFFVFMLFMKKVSPKTGKRIPREALENIGQFALNPKMQLNLLRLGNRLILVATTQDGVVETLTEINSPDEVSQILGICRKIDPNSSQAQFQSVLEEFAQAKTPPGFFGTTGEKSKTTGEPSLSSLLSSGLQDRGSKRKSSVAYG